MLGEVRRPHQGFGAVKEGHIKQLRKIQTCYYIEKYLKEHSCAELEDIMNRLLSRRAKDGPSHNRQKSRDKSANHLDKKDPDKKVTLSITFPPCVSLIVFPKSVFNQFISSPPAAFSNPNQKARPSIQLSKLSPTVTTSTDSRFGLLLQVRPLSSEINRLFKYDPQRILDKEQDAKVGEKF